MESKTNEITELLRKHTRVAKIIYSHCHVGHKGSVLYVVFPIGTEPTRIWKGQLYVLERPNYVTIQMVFYAPVLKEQCYAH